MIALDVGRVIGGRYRLERTLARGGMGSVWIARHVQLDTLAAIKFMDAAYTAAPDARSRFDREAKSLAQLQSPHIVAVHDYGLEEGMPYIVMELLRGEDLGVRLKRDKRLSLAATSSILGQATKALRRAHDAGIVHRDIKPRNVFLAQSDDEEVVKLIDFGVAKAPSLGVVGEATRTGMLVGSPHYMSPEQARRARDVDHRSDLWSLGVIAYRCITGVLPFPGDEVGDVIVKICTETAPSVQTIDPTLPSALDGFFTKALARDMNARYQSARELAQGFLAAVMSASDHGTIPTRDLDTTSFDDARITGSNPASTSAVSASSASKIASPDSSATPEPLESSQPSMPSATSMAGALSITDSHAALLSTAPSGTLTDANRSLDVPKPEPKRTLQWVVVLSSAALAGGLLAALAAQSSAPQPTENHALATSASVMSPPPIEPVPPPSAAPFPTAQAAPQAPALSASQASQAPSASASEAPSAAPSASAKASKGTKNTPPNNNGSNGNGKKNPVLGF
jgi:serine/threonine-protein kinase